MSERPKFRLVKIALWTLFLGFIAITVFGALPFQLAGLLLFGWARFLFRVLPQITLNWEIAFDAVVALSLALFGLHRILCWWSKHGGAGSASPWRFVWTLKISAMVLLLFATSIAAVGIVHQIAWLCRERNVIVMLGRGEETRDMSNLKQVVTAARLYADDHGERFPASLGELVPDYLTDYNLLFTRARGDDPPQPIVYCAGYNAGDRAQTILAASPRPFETSRGRHRIVAYLDTVVRIIPESEYQELRLQQRPTGRGQ